jgi:hypothetical protein
VDKAKEIFARQVRKVRNTSAPEQIATHVVSQCGSKHLVAEQKKPR